MQKSAGVATPGSTLYGHFLPVRTRPEIAETLENTALVVAKPVAETRFQDQCIRPLCHLSVAITTQGGHSAEFIDFVNLLTGGNHSCYRTSRDNFDRDEPERHD